MTQPAIKQRSAEGSAAAGSASPMVAARVSSGVLLLSPQRELLLCHATGSAHWDIPKGLSEGRETPRETAAREMLEETSLRVDPERLRDLGRFAYRPGKDLHLFAMWSERVDLGACVCTSQFRDRRGHLVPEVDAFEWTPFERVPQRCAKSMTTVLTSKLSLDRLWRSSRPAAQERGDASSAPASDPAQRHCGTAVIESISSRHPCSRRPP